MIKRLKSGGYRLYSRKKNPSTGRRRNLGTFKTAPKNTNGPCNTSNIIEGQSRIRLLRISGLRMPTCPLGGAGRAATASPRSARRTTFQFNFYTHLPALV